MVKLMQAAEHALSIGRSAADMKIEVADSKTVTITLEGAGSTQFRRFDATVFGGAEPQSVVMMLPVSGKPEGEGLYHCDCKDFQFSWHPRLVEINENIDSPVYDISPFPEYKPKNNSSPARASAELGMCKHVMALYNHLVWRGTIPVGAKEIYHGTPLATNT